MKALETVVSFRRDPAGNPDGGSLTAVSEGQMRECSGNRESVSTGALRGKCAGWVSLLRTLKDM